MIRAGMAERTFSVAYEGPALEDGTMDVRELAPALLALADIFRTANTTINSQAPPVTLEIRATNRGSFEVHLVLSQPDFIGNLISLLSSTGPTALANLLAIVIGTPQFALGLFGLIKRLRGHQVTRIENVSIGTVRLTLEDGTILELPAEVVTLYRSVTVRRSASEVIAPLRQDGVDVVRFHTDEGVTITVEKNDLPAFEAPSLTPVPLLNSRMELNLKVVSVTFQEDNKWRFSDGNQIFYAAVEDHEFIARVQNAEESFRNGDILRGQLRVRQEQAPDGDLRTEYIVEKVLEHIPRDRAIQIPMSEPQESEG
jgi:hypothetical protein